MQKMCQRELEADQEADQTTPTRNLALVQTTPNPS